MENHWEKAYSAAPSLCDACGCLGVRNVFEICMDIAAEHAVHLGAGYTDLLARGCIWVAVRTRIRFYDRLPMGADFAAETWPGKPGLAKFDRFYRLRAGDVLLAEGRTEWAVQDIGTGMVRRGDSFGYPLEMEVRPERLCAEPFTRFRDQDITGLTPVQTYTVGSMDIDTGQHMNNTAYIRLLLSTFSTAELAAMEIHEAEISYRRACFEGESLSVYRRLEEDAWFFEVRKPDGETAVHAKLVTAEAA